MICKICGKKLVFITNSHLRQIHNMTPQQYVEMFPGEMLVEPAQRRKPLNKPKPICAHPDCNKPVPNSWNTYCSYKCSMSHRMSKFGRNEQGGNRNHRQDNQSWWGFGRDRKKEARIRDHNTCQRCGARVKGKSLHVHHKVPAQCFKTPQEAHDIDNLVTLCNKCHRIVEWSMLIELFRRAKKLDELMFYTSELVPIEDYCGYAITNKIVEKYARNNR